MNQQPSGTSAVIVCLAAMVMLGCGNASGAHVDDLYQCQTIVTGQGEESRRFGFPVCLGQVLVKVSGDPRLIGDPEVAALAASSGRPACRPTWRVSGSRGPVPMCCA